MNLSKSSYRWLVFILFLLQSKHKYFIWYKAFFLFSPHFLQNLHKEVGVKYDFFRKIARLSTVWIMEREGRKISLTFDSRQKGKKSFARDMLLKSGRRSIIHRWRFFQRKSFLNFRIQIGPTICYICHSFTFDPSSNSHRRLRVVIRRRGWQAPVKSAILGRHLLLRT